MKNLTVFFVFTFCVFVFHPVSAQDPKGPSYAPQGTNPPQGTIVITNLEKAHEPIPVVEGSSSGVPIPTVSCRIGNNCHFRTVCDSPLTILEASIGELCDSIQVWAQLSAELHYKIERPISFFQETEPTEFVTLGKNLEKILIKSYAQEIKEKQSRVKWLNTQIISGQLKTLERMSQDNGFGTLDSVNTDYLYALREWIITYNEIIAGNFATRFPQMIF